MVEKSNFDYLTLGKVVLKDEAEALLALAANLDENFEAACRMISACQGKIVFCGVGQSAHVGRKTAASLASLGRPSFFVHATEAVHGDMGMITEADLVILISHSGETKETLAVLPFLRKIGVKTIAIVGKLDSSLARNCDVALSTGVGREAGPIQFAPTTSALATTALGDALAVAVAVSRGFDEKEYSKFHPAGSIGKQLLGDEAI